MLRKKSRVVLRSIIASILLTMFLLPITALPVAASDSMLLEIVPINPITGRAATEIPNNYNQTVIDTASADRRINFEARSAVGADLSDTEIHFEVSAKFGPDEFNEERLDTTAPFTAFGDENGRELRAGVYTVTARVCFSLFGCVGFPQTSQFVINNGFGISDVFLIDPERDIDIGPVVPFSGSTTPYNIRAETYGDIGGVFLTLLGPDPTIPMVQTTPPYALFGDTNGDYVGRTSLPGEYTLTVFPYAPFSGGGDGCCQGGESGAEISIPITIR